LSRNPRPKIKATTLNRVTPETRFYIDYSWWDESNLDLKTYLLTRLSISEDYLTGAEVDVVDLIDPNTGEVRRVDGFQYLVQSYFHQVPNDFITNASLVDAVFCVLLANANQPLTGAEIAAAIERPVDTVLRTLGGTTVYQGIRPLFEE
jgi:hypothetical protein